jgi:hypothetical protein
VSKNLCGEQIKSKHQLYKPRHRWWWKRFTSKKMRRQAKADPEGAPRLRKWSGWAD